MQNESDAISLQTRHEHKAHVQFKTNQQRRPHINENINSNLQNAKKTREQETLKTAIQTIPT